MKIDDYHFGRLTIDGRQYINDIIIFPDRRIQDGWRRRQGHLLTRGDIVDLVAAAPRVIIAGTGASGRMQVDGDVADWLQSKGIVLMAEVTGKAVEIFNEKASQPGVGACFHLTC